MNGKLYELLKPKLRNCQINSIQAIFKYLNSKRKEKSCLISLPTGGGKTGVIASTCLISNKKKILVLSHRGPVRDQLKKEIGGGFFNSIFEGKVDFKFLPAFKLEDNWNSSGVYVSTFQKLGKLSDEKLDDLIKNIDLLFVDEGHAEPAKEWSKISRAFSCPKIIITATPYRNDLFQFDISAKNGFIYTFKEALQEQILSPPIFESIEKDLLVDRVKVLLKKQKNTKCIVKCNTGDDVEKYRKLFSEEFITAAYHDRYKGNKRTENCSDNVPKNLRTMNHQVIIHQKKLDEGVDIPQAKIIVLTYPVSNGRELVQTIGRVVRLYNNCKSYVLDMSSKSNEKIWENYREFDKYLSHEPNWKKFLKSLDTSALIDSYLESFPEHSYFDSGFKRKFDLNSFDISRDLKLPLASICFINKNKYFSIPSFCSELILQRTFQGELIRHVSNVLGFDALISVQFKNSKYLSSHLFFEPSLEVTLIKDIGSYVAIFDSRASDFSRKKELGTGPAISQQDIVKLTALTKKVRTKEVHARAITSSIKSPEGISQFGKDLEDSNQSQINSSQALTRIKIDNLNKEGKTDSSFYLGTKSGRVADQKNKNFSLTDISNWIDDIGISLDSDIIVSSELINSYAQPINITPTTKPLSILIDLSWLDSHQTINGLYTLENRFYFFDYDDGFTLLEKDNNSKVKIHFNPETLLLELSSDKTFIIDSNAQNLLTELNENQDFKVIYEEGISYYDHDFYQHSLPTSKKFDFSLSKKSRALISLPELKNIDLTEKGTLTSQDSFDKNSVFYLIDQISNNSKPGVPAEQLGALYDSVPGANLVVCTDMGTEPADFIVASNNKLCFIHVKCGKSYDSPQSSAGALAEVGGQAIKNILPLASKIRDYTPGNWAELHNPWPLPNDAITLDNRVRMIDKKTAIQYSQDNGVPQKELMKEAWDKINSLRVSPSVEKEIWLVVGNAFSKKHFIDSLKKGKNAPSTSLQAYQLIDSWLSTCAINEIEFKIFVST
ncbi:MAG: DEAD/DEAH box helicase family protein [Colwellia sp.]|nr:DEAD/DEAH box helicase family protein [Colwellia sp.]